jgi:hypothetical protein
MLRRIVWSGDVILDNDWADFFVSIQTKKPTNRRNTMNKTIRLALIGASILALTSPVLARGVKGDGMTSHLVTGVGERTTAPVSLRERAPEPRAPIYGWNTNPGFDRASSPYRGGGY